MSVIFFTLLIFNAGIIFGSLGTIVLVRRNDLKQIDAALETVGIKRTEFDDVLSRVDVLESLLT